jgi:phosphoglycerate dehydrogenase-like enzyme
MHIVILDEVALNAHQKSRLKTLGTVTEYQDNTEDPVEIVRRLKDADIAVIAWAELTADILKQLPKLKLISIWQSGFHYVDLDQAAAQNITVANVPAYAGTSVAELTLGLMLALARHIVDADNATHRRDYSWQHLEGIELRGKTLGVIGVGNIGSRVIHLAKGFGMKVLATSLHPSSRRGDQMEVQFVPLDTLLKESDFITIQVPLSRQTEHLLGEHEFSLMKPTAYLISSTRGDIIEHAALRKALQEGRLAGAALDTILINEQSLTDLPNVIVTPRLGSYTTEALERKGEVCVTNVEQFLAGDPINVVSAED